MKIYKYLNYMLVNVYYLYLYFFLINKYFNNNYYNKFSYKYLRFLLPFLFYHSLNQTKQ